MSALDSATAGQGLPNPRKPLDSQKNTGTDMSIMILVQTNCPSIFAYQDQHYIRGLNAETLARVFLPSPPWLLSPEYTPLQPDPDEACPCIFFSLNLSIYNQNIDPEEWTEQWFFMNGRVHPYALTWKVEQLNGVESDDRTLVDYTIPTLIVRDQGYQPYVFHSCFSYKLITISFSKNQPTTFCRNRPLSDGASDCQFYWSNHWFWSNSSTKRYPS